MRQVAMTCDRLQALVDRFPEAHIAVVGDFFLDKYLDVEPALVEASIETGKPAHQVIDQRCYPGAAGTIVNNLARLEAGQVDAVGFTGDDGEAYELRRALDQLGCSTDRLHRSSNRWTPTYLKPRDACSSRLNAEHSRYDTKNRTVTPASLENHVTASVDELLGELDAVIVLDQVEERNCGVITDRVRSAMCDRARQNPQVIFWADSRRRIREFSHMIVKPNQFEAVSSPDPETREEVDLDALLPATDALRKQNQAPVIVTRGRLGMLVSDPEWTDVPSPSVQGPIDPTGAGDSATAGAVLALCAGADLAEAALIGNLVASITVQQIGTTGAARPEQLVERLKMWQSQQRGDR